ncbi:hypothetical protein D3C76_897350 [compost metagenome]
MLQTRPEVGGFCRRGNFVTPLKMARAVVIHFPVGDTVSVTAGHVCWHRRQDVLGFPVVVVIRRHRAFHHVVPDMHIPHGIHRVIIRP